MTRRSPAGDRAGRQPAPGPRPVDMLRDAPRMVRDPLGYLETVTARYGEAVVFPLPRSPVFLLNSPDAARRVLVDNHRGYTKRTVQYDTLALVTGTGLLVADPPKWTGRRRTLQPAFRHETLAEVGGYAATAASRVATDLAGRPDGSVVDIDQAMFRASLEVVGLALFGADLSGQATRLVQSVLAALDRVVVRARSPWSPPLAVPAPGNLRLRRALAVLDASVAAMVADRLKHTGPGQRTRRGDLLDTLLDARATLGDRAVRDEAVTMLVAGHETVASALTWACALLAAHPRAQHRLQMEVDALGRDPGWDDLPRLAWTRAVLDEALRLYPPAWVLSRRAVADDVLGGVRVPAGSVVLLCPWLLHRHPEAWAAPGCFDPGRFLGGRTQALPRGAYLPFGAGPRLCIGRDFALVEAVIVLATVARRCAVSPATGAMPAVDARVTLRPRGGLPLRLHRRPAGPGVSALPAIPAAPA